MYGIQVKAANDEVWETVTRDGSVLVLHEGQSIPIDLQGDVRCVPIHMMEDSNEAA